MRIKNYLIIVFSIFLLSGCALIELYQGFEYMENFKPHTESYEVMKLYGVVKNGEIDRMGLGKNDVDGIGEIIGKSYGIMFIDGRKMFPKEISKYGYRIKFYNDFKINFNGKKIIIPKEDIKLKNEAPFLHYLFYNYEFPKDLDNLTLNIGEIEIVDKDGKVIRKKRRIPTLVFKRAKYRERVLDWQNHYETYYEGWAENYHEYDESKEKE